jgi:ribosomal protein S18 acetylase RimI-like enzyme
VEAVEIVIRPVRPDEHAALADVTVAAYQSVPGETTSPGYEDTLRDVAGRAGAAEVLVAVDGAGTVLGGVTYVPGLGRFAEFEGEDEAGIRMLAVAPEAQRGGVGRRLVEACIDRARAARKTRIVLHTTEAMGPAQALYRSLGFERRPDRDLEADSIRLIAYVLELRS